MEFKCGANVLEFLHMSIGVFMLQTMKEGRSWMTCGFKSKWMALVGGSTIHERELVATGANKSCSEVVKSTCQALTCSTFFALASSFSNVGCFTFSGMLFCQSPISPLISLTIVALRVLLRVLSSSGSISINSKFRDLRPRTHQTKIFFF